MNAETFQEADLVERLQALWRRRGLMLAVGGAAFALTLLLALLLPPTYRSTATILIEQQEIPQDLVRSTITSFADQRVQVISQRVMTTQNLLQIIDRYGLYPDDRRTKAREVLLERIREDVGMAMIGADVIDPRSGRPTRANIAFSVSYENRSPDLAYKVANELTSLYLNENIASRAKQAGQAADFLSEESTRLSAQITDLDRQLSEFKQLHGDRLPELQQLNMTGMDRTELDLRDVANRLSALDQQRLLMEAQLAQIAPVSPVYLESGQRVLGAADRLKAMRAQLSTLSARYGPDHPDVLATKREIEGLAREVDAEADQNDLRRQLDQVRSDLAAARERYTADHPDVIRLTRTLEAAEAALAAAPRAPRPRAGTPDNPVYIQVKGQLDALLAERSALQRKQAELGAKVADYERRLAGAPEVERQYRALVRDYENARTKYQEVRAKQMEAQVAQNLETERKGERFTLIEPPLPPEKPVSPNRMLILVLGTLLSVALAIGAAVLRESMDATVRGASDLRKLVEVAPLVTLPRIVTSGEREGRRRVRRAALLGSAFASVLAVVAVHFLLLPLDLLWLVLQRRFGV